MMGSLQWLCGLRLSGSAAQGATLWAAVGFLAFFLGVLARWGGLVMLGQAEERRVSMNATEHSVRLAIHAVLGVVEAMAANVAASALPS